MNSMIQAMLNRPIPSIGATSSVSVTGTFVSFAEVTLPLIQWSAALVAVISGLIGIAIGAYHVKNIIIKEWRGE